MADEEKVQNSYKKAHTLTSVVHNKKNIKIETTENIIVDHHKKFLRDLQMAVSIKQRLPRLCRTLVPFRESKKLTRTEHSTMFMDFTNLVQELDIPIHRTSAVIVKAQEISRQAFVDNPIILNWNLPSTKKPMELLAIEWKSTSPVSEADTSFESQEMSEEKVNINGEKSIDDGFHECSDYFENSSYLKDEIESSMDYDKESENNRSTSILGKRKISKEEDCPRPLKKLFIKVKEENVIDKNECFFSSNQEDLLVHCISIQNMLNIMDQKKFYSFRKLFPSKIEKIGEGSFGEVYSGRGSNGIDVIYKIAPFEPNDKIEIFVNGGPLKGCRELTFEYIITNELSKLRERSEFYCDNFVRLYKGYIVNGTYPKVLLDAWKEYGKDNEVFNQDPREYKDKVKNYMILELEDAGVELEKYEEITMSQAYSVMFQLIHCMRIAEYLFHFEHRDLHESNILVQKIETNVDIEYTFNSTKYKLKSFGVKVKVIDYTLSRMSLNNKNFYYDLEELKDFLWGDFEPDTFQAVYPEMRKFTKGDWSRFCPENNLLWIVHHIKRFFSLGLIKDNRFVDFFLDKVSKMKCLEELVQDETFIGFQEDYISL